VGRFDIAPIAGAVADREIELLIGQFAEAVGGDQAQLDIRMLGIELAEPWHQPECRETECRADRDRCPVLRRGQALHAVDDSEQALADGLVQGDALGGQPHLPVLAVEEGDAEMRLQAKDLPADRRLGHVQLLCRSREVIQAAGSLEYHKAGYRRQ